MLFLITGDLLCLSTCFRYILLFPCENKLKTGELQGFFSYQDIAPFAELLVAASEYTWSFKCGSFYLISPKCDLFWHRWVLQENMVLQEPAKNNRAMKGWLYLGYCQDKERRIMLGWLC